MSKAHPIDPVYILTQEGQGRWTRYRLPAPSDSIHMGSDSIHMGVDSIYMGSDSIRNGSPSMQGLETLLQIATPARQQKRLLPKEMERILLALCHGKWLTRNQIAEIVDRNPESLRQRFLNPMVEHGLLRLRYPDKPNRTDQAYTAAAKGE